ncbi:MAG: nucleotide exchange factor GrpE [Thermoguttaceae bacterium]|nr:nucleotide exchange factor GrpE [Thermoguttaceae bacterium]
MKSDNHEKRDELPEFNETGPETQELSDDALNACADAANVASERETATVPKSEYDKLKKELDEAKDRGLRALAELENFRARTKRLHDEERKYASVDLARAILPVWDNLTLALNIDDPEHNGAAVLEGVRMVAEEFLKIFQKNGIEKIDALHKPFDPNFHESVAFMPSDEYPANTVLVEVKAGFKLYDRVIRATQVVLAAPAPAASRHEEA